MRNQFLVSAAALVAASAAHAGGFAAPVVETEPVAPVVVTEAPAWQGGYVGAALGYATGGDDRVGLGNPDGTGPVPSIGNAGVKGPNLTLRAGYRWQRDRWVVGPELTYTGGDISDEFDYAGGKFETKVNNELSLRLKTGYLVQDDMMVYGIAGVTRGDFTYTEAGKDVDFDASGYVLGLGVEKMINARMSLTGELEHSYFGKTEVDLPSGFVTQATPEHTNVKLGLNFKF